MTRVGSPLWFLAAGTFAAIMAGCWVIVSADWPADCDPHVGSGHRGFQLYKAYGCSFRLLSGSAQDIAAFATLYLLPIAVIGLVIFVRRGRARQTSVE